MRKTSHRSPIPSGDPSPLSMTTIYLVRHAHADWSPDDARPLSPAGLETAERVKGILSAYPIAAIYTSPSRRSMMTVAPLARSLSIRPEPVDDLRERALPIEPVSDFTRMVQEFWNAPDTQVAGESNAAAQARGLGVLRRVLARHDGQHVVLATHGTLLTLILNGYDSTLGFEFWRGLSFPDVYRLEFERGALNGIGRCWETSGLRSIGG
jgi:2,3-bisphosphoglycerate-dependent phosphoglycerate mutase